MYQMKKCVKCNSENIEVGTLGGPAATMALSGIEDWLAVYKTYTCKDCGYTEIVKEFPKVKENKKID